jgi:hypothetical protein
VLRDSGAEDDASARHPASLEDEIQSKSTGEIEMMKFVRIGLVIAAAGMALVSTEASARPHCVLAGGQSVMATLDLAKFMANAALKNSMAAHGWTAHGPVRMRCDTSSIGLPHCLARQKACG